MPQRSERMGGGRVPVRQQRSLWATDPPVASSGISGTWHVECRRRVDEDRILDRILPHASPTKSLCLPLRAPAQNHQKPAQSGESFRQSGGKLSCCSFASVVILAQDFLHRPTGFDCRGCNTPSEFGPWEM